jgi:FKBP-type peptidyl-prolyl cis-trans isomerase FkpA
MIRMNFRALIMFSGVLLTLSVVSCDPAAKLRKEENAQIQEYLSQNIDLDFVKEPSGLYYFELVAGSGESPVVGDSAYVKYTGKFLDGTIFDSTSSTGLPYGFIVGTSISGFDEGVSMMKPGGKSTFLIPSSLGYGETGTYQIPGFTTLLFDVELVKVVPYTGI